MRRVYLDHNATTPLDPRVFEAMAPVLRDTFGNASSLHWYGQQARAALDQARGEVAALLSARRRPRSSSPRAARRRTTWRCAAWPAPPGSRGARSCTPRWSTMPCSIPRKRAGRGGLARRGRARARGRPLDLDDLAGEARRPHGGWSPSCWPTTRPASSSRSRRSSGWPASAARWSTATPCRRPGSCRWTCARWTSIRSPSPRTRCTGRRAWARSTSGATRACALGPRRLAGAEPARRHRERRRHRGAWAARPRSPATSWRRRRPALEALRDALEGRLLREAGATPQRRRPAGAEHCQPVVRGDRGREPADGARPGRRRGLHRRRLRRRRRRAVARAARDGPAARARAGVAALLARPLHDRRGRRLRRSAVVQAASRQRLAAPSTLQAFTAAEDTEDTATIIVSASSVFSALMRSGRAGTCSSAW